MGFSTASTAKDSGTNAPELSELLPKSSELRGLDCFLCGPPGLVTAAVALVLGQGVAAEHIHFERFDFR